MTNTMRTNWPAVQQWVGDYPAVTTFLALLLVSLVPYLQYNSWANEGLELGQKELEPAKQAGNRGDFYQASWHLENALDYYSRPLIFNHPQALDVKFRLAQIYHYRMGSPYTAIDYYISLINSDAYAFDSLAGLWLLRGNFDFNEYDKFMREEIVQRVTIYSDEALAEAPEDQQLRADAARFSYALGNAYIFQGDLDRARTEFARAQALSPENVDYQNAADSVLPSAIELHFGPTNNAILSSICSATSDRDLPEFERILCQAVNYQASGQYENASDSYDTARRLKPQDDRLRLVIAYNSYSWGQELTHNGQLEEAILAYRRAHELAPENSLYAQAAEATIVTLTIKVVARNTQGRTVEGASVKIEGKDVGITDASGNLQVDKLFLSIGELSIDVHLAGVGFYATAVSIGPKQADYSVDANLEFSSSSVYDMLNSARAYVRAGNPEQAEAGFKRATQWAAEIEDSHLNNSICWRGSLDGYAGIVLPACEYGVRLSPSSYSIIDSRGLARALTGDYEGAIEDFKYFVDLSPNEAWVSQRRSWIAELEAGRNPFDAATLKLLESQ